MTLQMVKKQTFIHTLMAKMELKGQKILGV
jgi:hypothetical protein